MVDCIQSELWKNEVWLGEGEKTDFSRSLKMLKSCKRWCWPLNSSQALMSMSRC